MVWRNRMPPVYPARVAIPRVAPAGAARGPGGRGGGVAGAEARPRGRLTDGEQKEKITGLPGPRRPMPTLDPPVDPRVETLLEPSEEMPPCDAPDPSPSGSGEARRTPRAAAAIRPAAARVEALIGDARLRIGGALQAGSRVAARR